MSEVKKAERKFVGKAWMHTVDKDGSEHNGKKYINVVLDQEISELKLVKGEGLLLFENDKREGENEKTGKPFQDPDFRVSISEPQAKANA